MERWWGLMAAVALSCPLQVFSKLCAGGYHCTSPHECCVQGCCLFIPSPGTYNPNNPNTNNNLDGGHDRPTFESLNPTVKYYVWLTLLAIAFGVASVWWCKTRACRCCRGRGNRGEEWCCPSSSRASEPDSAGSCYYPPQYSRCGSLCRLSSGVQSGGAAQPPPPYNEVAAKPDLYPMVIYLGDKADGDFMVHYYKNYIVRPNGSLSATSTVDSLSSSFLCNTANEANTLVPPPYSCAGNVEWSPVQRQAMLRSNSSVTCHHEDNQHHHQQHQQQQQQATTPRRPLYHSNSENANNNANTAQTMPHSSNCAQTRVKSLTSVHQSNEENADNNHRYFNVWDCTENGGNQEQGFNIDVNYSPKAESSRYKMSEYLDGISLEDNDRQSYSVYMQRRQSPDSHTHCNENIDDVKKYSNKKYRDYSFSMEDNQTCSFAPSDYSIFNRNINNFGSKEDVLRMYDATGSEISSLANLGTPDSPPRATSPTSEVRELLDKIQRLPTRDESSESFFAMDGGKTKRYFGKSSRKSSLYMPLNLVTGSGKTSSSIMGVSPTSSSSALASFARKSWLSRSAPTTPCGLAPLTLMKNGGGGAQSSNRTLRTSKSGNQNGDADNSPLLMEHDDEFK